MHYKRWRKYGDPNVVKRPVNLSLADRLAIGMDRSAGPDACWPWTGMVHGSGYGMMEVQGLATQSVHRIVYEFFVGPIPDDLVIDHLCHTRENCHGGRSCLHRRCTNPSHLGVTTNRDNCLRGLSPPATYATRTHCAKGHELTEDNLMHWRSDTTRRRCRTCENARYQERQRMKHLASARQP